MRTEDTGQNENEKANYPSLRNKGWRWAKAKFALFSHPRFGGRIVSISVYCPRLQLIETVTDSFKKAAREHGLRGWVIKQDDLNNFGGKVTKITRAYSRLHKKANAQQDTDMIFQ